MFDLLMIKGKSCAPSGRKMLNKSCIPVPSAQANLLGASGAPPCITMFFVLLDSEIRY
jgi:hypothetical protein